MMVHDVVNDHDIRLPASAVGSVPAWSASKGMVSEVSVNGMTAEAQWGFNANKAPAQVKPLKRARVTRKAPPVGKAPVSAPVARPADIVVETSKGPVGFVRTGEPITEVPTPEIAAERAAKGDVFVSSYRNKRGNERVSLNISADLADTVLELLEQSGLTITKGRDAA